jgi:addiction module HigA family antidote
MIPFGLNPNKLAMALRVAPPNIYDIVKEDRGISSEMALRLGRFFSTTPEFWINLQAHYDLSVSRQEIEKQIKDDIRPLVATGQRN